MQQEYCDAFSAELNDSPLHLLCLQRIVCYVMYNGVQKQYPIACEKLRTNLHKAVPQLKI